MAKNCKNSVVRKSAVAGFFFFLAASSGHSGNAQEAHPCREDAQKFCAETKGFPKRVNCLEAHSKDLSPACRNSLSAMRVRGQSFHDHCGRDAKKLCPGLEGRPLVDCLDKNSALLGPACATAMESLKGDRQELHERIPIACRSDVEKLCSDVKPGEGRLMNCLKAHENWLSRDCQGALHDEEKTTT